MEVDEQPFTDGLEGAEKKKLGIPFKVQRDFKSLFSWPAKEKPLLKTAAETINESAACKKAAALEEKESAINMYLKFVQDAEGKTAMQAELQKTLDGMIKERDIFSKKGQELVINVERMKEAQQKQVADWAERMEKWKVNGNAEAAKAEKRKGALQEQIQIATKALADLQEAETENKQKWAEELVVQMKWHEEKLAEWQTRINSVVNVPSEVIPPTPSPPPFSWTTRRRTPTTTSRRSGFQAMRRS